MVALYRFLSLPNILKIFHVIFTIGVMICVGEAGNQPPGTEFIWITTSVMLGIGLLTIVLLALEIEGSIANRLCCNWPVFETAYSVVASIFYFVSVWLCVNGAQFNKDSTAFTVAAFFCFANFVTFGFNAVLFLRIFVAGRRHADAAANIQTSGMPSYGGP